MYKRQVLAHFEGGWNSIEEIVQWCRKGPRRADVTDVEVTKVAPIGADGFDVDRE